MWGSDRPIDPGQGRRCLPVSRVVTAKTNLESYVQLKRNLYLLVTLERITSIGSEQDKMFLHIILNKGGCTFRSLYVFLRKLWC